MYYINLDNKILYFEEDKTRLINTIKHDKRFTESDIEKTDSIIENYMIVGSDEHSNWINETNKNKAKIIKVSKLELMSGIVSLSKSTYSEVKKIIELDDGVMMEWELSNEVNRDSVIVKHLTKNLKLKNKDVDSLFLELNKDR